MVPNIYIHNVCSLAKSHTTDNLYADLIAYNVNIAFIVETFLIDLHDNLHFDGYT